MTSDELHHSQGHDPLLREWRAKTVLPWSSGLAIDTVVDVCEQAGCSPMFVYIPNSDFWRPDSRAAGYARKLRQYGHSANPDAPFIGTTERIREQGMDAYAPAGQHLSPLGYRIVADMILEAVRGQGGPTGNDSGG